MKGAKAANEEADTGVSVLRWMGCGAAATLALLNRVENKKSDGRASIVEKKKKQKIGVERMTSAYGRV